MLGGLFNAQRLILRKKTNQDFINTYIHFILLTSYDLILYLKFESTFFIFIKTCTYHVVQLSKGIKSLSCDVAKKMKINNNYFEIFIYGYGPTNRRVILMIYNFNSICSSQIAKTEQITKRMSEHVTWLYVYQLNHFLHKNRLKSSLEK